MTRITIVEALRGPTAVRAVVWLPILLALGNAGPVDLTTVAAPAAAEATSEEPAESAVEPQPRARRASQSQGEEVSEAEETPEQRVLAFVREHNPDLAAVLARLERRSPSDYETAVEDLDRTVAKLLSGKAKDPELHAIEVRVWQTRTRVEMLVAQLMAGTAKSRAGLEAQLREAVAEELAAKASHLGYRKQRSMAWYDRQIDRIRHERDELVEARVRSLLREQSVRKEASGPGR